MACVWEVPEFSYGAISETTCELSLADLLRGPQTTAHSGWSWVTDHFRVHVWDRGLWTHYLRHPRPLVYDASGRSKSNGAVAKSLGMWSCFRLWLG